MMHDAWGGPPHEKNPSESIAYCISPSGSNVPFDCFESLSLMILSMVCRRLEKWFVSLLLLLVTCY